MFKKIALFFGVVSILITSCGPAGSVAPIPTPTPVKLEYFQRGDLGMVLMETRSIEIKRGEIAMSGITIRSLLAKRYSVDFVCYDGGKVVNFLEQSGGLFSGMEMKPRIEVRLNAQSCQGDLYVTFWLDDQNEEILRVASRIYVLE